MRLLIRSVLSLFATAAALLPGQTFGHDWYPHPAQWYPSMAPSNCGFNCPERFPLTPSNQWAQPDNGKAQMLVPLADLPQSPRAIQDIGFLPMLLADYYGIYRYDRIRVTLAQTPSATLSNTFAANLAINPVVVMDRTDHYWTPNGHQDPVKWVAGLGFDVAYPFDPALGNLVIDIEVEGGAQILGTGFYGFVFTNTQTVASYAWSSVPASGQQQTAGLFVMVMCDKAGLEEYGRPCPTAAGGMPFLNDRTFEQPVLGTVQNLDLASGVPNGVAVLVGGTSLFGLDLTPFGAPQCVLHPVPEASALMALDGLGEGSLALPLPNSPSLAGARLWFQCAVLDPAANALGIATSSYVRLLLGIS